MDGGKIHFKDCLQQSKTFNRGQFYIEISIFGYFKKLEKVRVHLLWLTKLVVAEEMTRDKNN